MLLIDGVKYELWTPPSEDEFERVVEEHAQDIFGEQSVYFGKKKLKSISGVGSIPDGFVIIPGTLPQWHIVEVELSTHPLHEHIVSQVSRFITGISSPVSQKKLAEAIYQDIVNDDFLKLKVQKATGSAETYKFLSDLISRPPILTVIIEKDTPGLSEATLTLRYPEEIKVVEFQTFIRENAALAVHAHLFEPLYQPSSKNISMAEEDEEEITPGQKFEKRVTAKHLIDANILKVGQIVYGWHHTTKYEGKVLNDGSIELLQNGRKFPSLNAAVHNVKGSAEDAWRWWLTKRENGSECVLDELRKEYRKTHPSNP